MFAELVNNGAGKVNLHPNGHNPLIRLFTIAADCRSQAMDPATHLKNDVQYLKALIPLTGA